MPSFGLIAHLEATRISLPLVHVESRFRVTGDLVSVELDQVFEQNAREALDVTYTFPLPGEASVYRCELHVNGRIIRAVVMEETEARQRVQEKKAQGYRTALVEVDRDNLFTLELGNTAPGDQLRIRFAYLQPLERLADQLSLRIPFCPGIRYIPGKPLLRGNRGRGVCDDTDQVPDASRISPPRISRDHPDAATVYVQGVFDADELKPGSLASPSHAVQVYPQEGQLAVELAGEQHVPDRDFILRWQEATVTETRPRAWSCTTEEPAGGAWRYGLLQLRAPREQAAQEELVQDVYFLLDRSGSMHGDKWQQCAVALRAFVAELGARDRVWITCFESEFQDFSDAPMVRDDLLADEGFQNLHQIGTDGGTELLPALEHVLAVRRKYSRDLPARLILITDGQVGNEDEIQALLSSPAARDLPVHSFGIDTAVNDAFLHQIARLTGGRCTLMSPQDDIPAAIRRLAVTLRRPVLTDLRLPDEVATPDDTAALPDLHAGEVLLLPVRVRDTDSVMLSARLPDGRPWSVRWQLDGAEPSPAPRLAWIKRHLNHLLESGNQPLAVQLAIQHNLACRGTAFVAWDDAEQTPVAKHTVVQPSLDIDPLAWDANLSMSSPSLSDDALQMSMLQLRPRLRSAKPAVLCCSINFLAEEMADRMPDAIHPQLLRLGITADHAEALARHPWTQRFQNLLETRLGLPAEIARAVALLLRHWADALIGFRRRQQLDAWLARLEQADSDLSLLASLLAAVPDEPVAEALSLLNQSQRPTTPPV